jgi:hypothetical protein
MRPSKTLDWIFRTSAIIIFLLTINLVIYAQDTDSVNVNSQVYVQLVHEAAPIVGRSWSLTIIIDYPNPEEVTVVAPSFVSLSLERFAKSLRLMGDRLQTVVDYRFIPNRAGRFTLESFAIICPSGIATTEPFVLNIQTDTEEQRPVVLKPVWEGVAGNIEKGERAILTLHSNIPPPSGNDDSQQISSEFFMPEVPVGLILSSLQLTDEERIDGILAKFGFIPLEGDIYLASRVLQYENIIYEIPALRITVTNRPIERIIEIYDENTSNFPINEENLFFLSLTKENKRQRTVRLGYFYSILFLVIITIIICLYLLLRKK